MEVNQIKYETYWKRGGVWYLRESLPDSHPENLYNYVKREFNINPEDFGIYKLGEKEAFDKYENYTQNELILRIYELEQYVEQFERMF